MYPVICHQGVSCLAKNVFFTFYLGAARGIALDNLVHTTSQLVASLLEGIKARLLGLVLIPGRAASALPLAAAMVWR